MRTALVVGATGLIGKNCVYQLLETKAYTRVIVLVRKPLPVKHHQLQELLVDFDHLEQVQEQLVADDVYCCLGTTIRVAGSQENFRKVDYEYPLKVAELCLKNGAQQLLLVSAMGADASSSIFYNRVKGEVEKAIEGLGYPSFHVFRPSLLLGMRKEVRVGELIAKGIMKALGWLLLGPLAKYKAIEGETVAKAMVLTALQASKGVWIYPSDQIAWMVKRNHTLNDHRSW